MFRINPFRNAATTAFSDDCTATVWIATAHDVNNCYLCVNFKGKNQWSLIHDSTSKRPTEIIPPPRHRHSAVVHDQGNSHSSIEYWSVDIDRYDQLAQVLNGHWIEHYWIFYLLKQPILFNDLIIKWIDLLGMWVYGGMTDLQSKCDLWRLDFGIYLWFHLWLFVHFTDGSFMNYYQWLRVGGGYRLVNES